MFLGGLWESADGVCVCRLGGRRGRDSRSHCREGAGRLVLRMSSRAAVGRSSRSRSRIVACIGGLLESTGRISRSPRRNGQNC